ncbi:type VI secretion system-associated protein TagF [Thiohalocapsa sp. ML1]|uniref:type VI secretion system-associated protein TagF n=1 Tax=Thiohalocapsa sp. ML1 TaxID=1431688 RepID=UPI000731F336|nr:type VI secretion system-associated protein TagF [Thiohalocapsa sp. ML1]
MTPDNATQIGRPGEAAAGFFGKLPTLGDFVARRLPAQFVQPWDHWLTQGLAESRARLGDDWLDTYLVSPLWRFVLAPGIAGRMAWAGVMMPSVDRVGRYFPLTLARSAPAHADCFALLGATDWFGQLEALALSTLADGFDLNAFDTGLLQLPAPPVRLVEHAAVGADTGRPDAWELGVADDALDGACSRLLHRALEDVFLSYSLWWSTGSEQVSSSLLTCQGLPAPEAYVAMLGGHWEAGGWTRLGAV